MLDEPAQPAGELRELVKEYKSIATTILQQRGAFQFIDTVQSMTDPAARTSQRSALS